MSNTVVWLILNTWLGFTPTMTQEIEIKDFATCDAMMMRIDAAWKVEQAKDPRFRYVLTCRKERLQ